MWRLALVGLISVVAWGWLPSGSLAEHTYSTRKGEVYGMPSCCCKEMDCFPAKIRLLDRGTPGKEGRNPLIYVDGKVVEVIGCGEDDGHGFDRLYEKDGNIQSYYCPLRRGGDNARCALVVKPGGDI